jgi:hypothetical protein
LALGIAAFGVGYLGVALLERRVAPSVAPEPA